jgi:uncharacterized protein (TIGR03118 family)
VKHKFAMFLLCVLLAGSGLIADGAFAQTKAYRQTNLASSVPNVANNDVPSLTDPWAIAVLQGQPFLIADGGSGSISALNSSGAHAGAVAVPAAPGNKGRSMPTGIVSDGSGVFGPPSAPFQYVVVTQSGTISGFASGNGNLPVQATLARDDSAAGAVYTAVALLHPDCCAPFVAVADFNDGSIHTFTNSFELLDGAGSFRDPNLPAGYAPYGMQTIGKQLFVTYALQDAAKRGPVFGAGNGVVDVFDTQGNFVRRFAAGGSLNAPWGIALAGTDFGPFSGAILIGNFGDGTISAFDAATGNFLGQVKDGDGNVIANPGIRGLAFRADAVMDSNTLFFTAGIENGEGGLFGTITTGLVSTTRVSIPAAAVTTGAMLTATVDAGPGNSGMPSGMIAIASGGVPQGTAPVVHGVATFTMPTAGMGMHVIDVHFSGDAAFLPSSSSTQMQVTGLGTTVALTAPAKAAHGSPVTMTATINSMGGIPAGNIEFHDGNAGLGSAPMNAMGIARFTVNTLAAGVHSLTASFGGAGNFAASMSATVITDVSGGPDFAVATNPTSVMVTPGQSAPVMVTVTPSGGFNSSVILSCSSVPGVTCTFGSATLVTNNGAASTTMNINTTTGVPRYGFLPPGNMGLGVLLSALSLLGLMIWRSGRFVRVRVPALGTAAVLAMFACSLTLGGCGYGSSYTPPPQNSGPAVLTVTAQSGTLSHTATVNVTVQ